MILETRARTPSAVAAATARRRRRPWLGPSGRLMIIAADHPARGALGVGERPLAMANRFDLLDRILETANDDLLAAAAAPAAAAARTGRATCRQGGGGGDRGHAEADALEHRAA